MNVDLVVVIAVGGFVLSAAAFFIGRVSAGKASGKQEGITQTDIGYIKAGIDNINTKLEKYDDKFIEICERLAVVESAVKSAHKRLDDHGVGRIKE